MMEEEDLADFEMDVKVPMNKLSIIAPSANKQNKKDVGAISESISVIKKLNEHLEKYQLKKGNSNLKFQLSCADTKQHFKRTQSDAYKIIDQIRNSLILDGIEPKLLKDKNSEQIVVIRVVKCEQDHIIVQDSSGMDTIMIQNGFFWVGMITTIKIVWEMGKYHFKETISKHNNTSRKSKNISVNPGQNQTRISVASGPYIDPAELQWIGLQLIRRMVIQNHSNILILMGPFVDYNHPSIKSNKCPKSYIQMMNDVLKYLNEISGLQVYLVPSTSDVLHLYPIPQPRMTLETKFINNIIPVGNPSYLQANKLTIQLINHDFIQSIRNNSCGKVDKQLIQRIYDQYLQQEIIMSCFADAPTAQNKLKSMYLNGKSHGKIILYSSKLKQANVIQRRDTLFINVGSMMGNCSRVGNLVNLTYFEQEGLDVCDSTYVQINRLAY